MTFKHSFGKLGLCMLLALVGVAGSIAKPAAADALTEFDSAEKAAAFGWKGIAGAVLDVSDDAKAGIHSIEAKGIGETKPYAGLELTTSLDLTKAGKGDQIVFDVKQNFGTSLWVNVNGGEVYQSVRIKKGEWMHVVLDMKLAQWMVKKGITQWPVLKTISFYQKAFDGPDKQLLIDGLRFVVQGKEVAPVLPAVALAPDWRPASENAQAWLIGDEQALWAISKKSGQVLGGWNAVTKEQYLNWDAGRYLVQDAKSTFKGEEERDQIGEKQFNQAKRELRLMCSNPALDDLEIEKHYSVQNGRLIKKVGFTSSQVAARFITYNSEVSFTSAYRDAGYYFGAGFLGPLVPAPKIKDRQKVTQYRSTTKGMVLSQSEKGYSFAQYRTKTNDKFVWPWWAKYSEAADVLSYTPTGWEMSLGTLKLNANQAASYEEHFSIFPGTWQQFLSREYSSLPEVQKERSRISAPPKWLEEVKLHINFKGLENLRQAVEAYDEGDILVLLNPVANWADYDPRHPQTGWSGGSVSGPELKKLVEQIRALSPRIKVGFYHFENSALADGEIYKNHPEWFRKYDKEGNATNLFPGLAANYASMIDNPALYQNLQEQLRQEMKYFMPDFINLDESKTNNLIDWKTGGLTTDDQWQQFWLEMNLNAKKQNPDVLMFFNGRGNPYSALNYIEARSQLRPQYWREFAGMALGMEAFITPPERIIPLYWIPNLSQSYSNHALALGWIPKPEQADILRYRPFVTAIYEMGNATPVDAKYTPDWKRDPSTQLESYFMRRGAGQEYALSLISHEKQSKTFPITINAHDLDLNQSSEISIWGYRIADSSGWKNALTESEARRAYAQGGWMLDRITTPELLYHGAYQPQIQLNVRLNPLEMYMVSISDQPGAIYSENDLPNEFRFAASRQVRVSGKRVGNAIRLTVDSQRDNAEVLVALPAKSTFKAATVDGQSVSVQLNGTGDVLWPVISVGKGRHEVQVSFTPDASQRPQHEKLNFTAQAAAGAINVAVSHTLSAAFITVSQNDQRVFEKLIPVQNGICKIPLTAGLMGSFSVDIGATQNRNDSFSLIQSAPVTLQLATSKPPAPATLPLPVIEGKTEMREVNKTINGVRILRQATETTTTSDDNVQQGKPGLMATADATALNLTAGTTDKIINFEGAAFAGFEMEGVKQVKLRLENTFYNAFSLRGEHYHYPAYKETSRFFAGVMVHYHTPQGYTKKVALGAGALADKCNTVYPTYAARRAPDQLIDLGDLIDRSPDTTFALDLTQYAPIDWDGKLWLSVGSDMVAADRRLRVHLLSFNEKAGDQFLEGIDPAQREKIYREPRSATIPHESEPPMIDGAADEEIWKAAAPIKPFFPLGGKGSLAQGTDAVAYYDDTHLYLRIICQENQRPRPITGRGAIWEDDEVEIWMSPQRDGKSYQQLLINAGGEKLEMNQNGTAQFGAQVAARIEDGRWIIEAAIPFKGLDVAMPKAGDEWRFNIVRHRPADGGTPAMLATWSPLEKGFNEPQNFATLKFTK